MRKTLLSTALATALTAFAAAPAAAIGLFDDAAKAWTHSHAGAGFLAEIVSFDSATRTLWVAGVAGVDVLDARTGALVQRIDTRAFGSINSVAVHNGIAAFAMENMVRSNAGQVVLFDTTTRALASGVNTIAVGALPDMLTFTRDGSRLLVANEGTPNFVAGSVNDYGTRIGSSVPRVYGYASAADQAARDPVGSVSIITMASRTVSATATLAGVAQRGTHLRTSTGMDFEPEYLAVNAAGTRAYVALQEANGMGVLNLETGRFEQVIGLGAKDYSLAGNRIDPLNNAAIELVNVNAKGLYMPDGMAAYEAAGKTYVVMANEGDFREDDADRSAASSVGATGLLANLRIANTESSSGALFSAGARSFSIRDANGVLVYDSGEILDREAIAAGVYDDARSRDKGVEPEGVELITLAGRTYAFIGLERTTQSTVAVFDITDPAQASFVRLLVSPTDLSPEGLKGYTLDGFAYLAFANEVSNTTTVFQLTAVPEPGTWALMAGGLLLVGGASRRRR